MLLAHIIASKPVIVVDHYTTSINVGIKNIEVPAFREIEIDVLRRVVSKTAEAIALNVANPLSKLLRLELSQQRHTNLLDIYIPLKKSLLIQKFLNTEQHLKRWTLNYVVYHLLTCLSTPMNHLESTIAKNYQKPEVPYSTFKSLFSASV